MKPHYVDSCMNRVVVEETGLTLDGKDLLVVRLANNPNKGYVVLNEGDGAFGDEDCPSSYHMPCMAWFGPEERYPNAETLLNRLAQ